MKKRYQLCIVLLLLTMSNAIAQSIDTNEVNTRTDLPLTIIPATGNAVMNTMAIFFSGDGGWTNFDGQMADELAKKGITVIGLNSRKYFWDKKTPAQTRDDVTYLIRHYSRVFKKRKILLLGFSFGADVMPFVFNRLPRAIHNRVQAIILMSPSKDTDFEVHLIDLLNLPSSPREFNVPDEIKLVRAKRLICFFGKDEANTCSDELLKANINVTLVDGGHHYDDSGIKVIIEQLFNKN
jgi:type IV secretory pathway VirJ component